MLNFIIWDGSPVAFSIGPFVLRWYVLLFILGFIVARFVLAYVYKKEGKPTADVEKLTIYILGAALIGARLGYVLFYEPMQL
jgi:prolipoprotein diacylglyceryltransferase